MRDRPTLWEWIGLRPIDTSRDSPVGQWVVRILLLGLFLISLALVALAIGAAFTLLAGIVRGDALSSETGFGPAAAAGVLIVAILGAPFVVWRAVVAQKTVDVAEQGMITDRINKAVQGLGAEKTVKELIETPRYRKDENGGWLLDEDGNLVPATRPDGSPLINREEVERTVPNLEVRIGAIYALERIAQDSLRDHIQIMEILCAYIRENAPASQERMLPKPPEIDGNELGKQKPKLVAWLKEHKEVMETKGRDGGPIRPREDIQVAITVIGRRGARQRAMEMRRALPFAEAVGDFPPCPIDMRTVSIKAWKDTKEKWEKKLTFWRAVRSESTYRLDLRGTDLAGAVLLRLNFENARLDKAVLDGANLYSARLDGASLSQTSLNRARLMEAQLKGADLSEVGLCYASLSSTQLDGAFLKRAQINGSYLFRTRLGGASLSEAQINFSEIKEAQLDGTTLTNARLHATGFKNVNLSLTNITLSQIAALFGDASVILPGGVTPDHVDWPQHWPKEKLDWKEFDKQYKAWLKEEAAEAVKS